MVLSIVSQCAYLFTWRKLILFLRLENSVLPSCSLFIWTSTPSLSFLLAGGFYLDIPLTQICLTRVQLDFKKPCPAMRRSMCFSLNPTTHWWYDLGTYYRIFLYCLPIFSQSSSSVICIWTSCKLSSRMNGEFCQNLTSRHNWIGQKQSLLRLSHLLTF